MSDWIDTWPTQFLIAVLDVKMAERFNIIFPQNEGTACKQLYE